ncbi:UNVERIFIED_CONTAM: Glycerol-3-phosphate acyltransferase RAM2 [Sesamum latifolium]|uniref:Glycerol-3-phosphate acyltransferase RAM2 n=1 Tax=Sesamum latifolium TaxID=2727402 RepID=A0AAW2XCS7_9LAMI
MRVSDIESVASAVLPKFYSGDLHPETWRVFSSCGTKCVLTANPRIMVEAFLKEYLGADLVIGTEISTYKGRATGLVTSPGILVGKNKAEGLRKAFGNTTPEIGIGDRKTDHPFMNICKESYMVQRTPKVQPVSPDKLLKPIVFHDGRLVQKPSPLMALLIILWIPIGFILACIRIAAGSLLPMPMVYHAFRALGVRVTIKGTPPPRPEKSLGQTGVLFVCSHRTLLDPIFLSTALGRAIPAVTYSLSRLSEIISPIKTVRLNRDRAKDADMIKKLLKEGDLVICPEGTTCREPFLLRFSALFAELTDELVPVAMSNRMSMFHGTTARGWKGMDPFYFFMNPSPAYEVTFLNKLPGDLTCGLGNQATRRESVLKLTTGGSSAPLDPTRVTQISWNPRAFLYRGFLTHKECDHLISLAKDKLEKSMVADNDSGKSIESEVRTSSGMFLSKAQDEIVAGVEERIAAWTFLPIENGEAMQILHYEHGQKYEPHFDFFHDKANQELGGHRVATVLMYLSDVARGGETVFPNSDEKDKQPKSDDWSECAKQGYAVKPRKGDALLFFSLHPDATTDNTSLHGSCPVIEGEKWSATKWIHVRSFDIRVSSSSSGDCVDENPNCPAWALRGECEKNPLYMIGSKDGTGYCRKSCKVCSS